MTKEREALKTVLEALALASNCLKKADAYVRYASPLLTPSNVAEPQPKREWVGLTHKEIMEIDSTYYRPMGPLEFAKLVEAKLKELNK